MFSKSLKKKKTIFYADTLNNRVTGKVGKHNLRHYF